MVKVLDYCSDGCRFESLSHQADAAGPLRKALNAQMCSFKKEKDECKLLQTSIFLY